MKKNVINIIYNKPFTVSKSLELITLLEAIVSPERLSYQLDKSGTPIKIENMSSVLELAYKTDQFPVLNNGKEECLVSLSAYDIVPNSLNQGFHTFYFVYPDHFQNIDAIYKVLKEIGDKTDAYLIDIRLVSQHYNPKEHTIFVGRESLPIKINLPVITNKTLPGQHMWEIPFNFSWINFWSKAIIDKVGLRYESDKDLFYKSIQLDNGGVLFQLTEEPLNINNDEHLETLRRCYERFDKIGNRYLLKDI